MKPLIGISGKAEKASVMGLDQRFIRLVPEMIFTPRDYVSAVEAAGGIPVVLPQTREKKTLEGILDRIDGLLLTGGEDIDPLLYGEDHHMALTLISPDRDFFDLYLAKKALEKDMALLGICRGMQVINVATGGSLYQDIKSQAEGALRHTLDHTTPKWHQSHEVIFSPEAKLRDIYQTDRMWVNGFHHQAVKDLGTIFFSAGATKDGLIEAIESRDHRFAIGVQWHPEMMLERHREVLPLFESFVEAAMNH